MMWNENLLAGIIWIKHGISWRPTELLAQHANVSSESAGARYVIVLTNPFDVIREFNTYSIWVTRARGNDNNRTEKKKKRSKKSIDE